jgi:hypothetical protein
MPNNLDDSLDTSPAQRERDAARPLAQATLDRITSEGCPLWKMITSASSMALLLVNVIITTFSVFYIFPLLPGVTFDGSIYEAAQPALVMLVASNIIAHLMWLALKDLLKRMAEGKKVKWSARLPWVIFAALIPVELAILCFYLSLDGFWAYVYVCLTFGVMASVYGEIKPFVISALAPTV